MNFFVDLFIIKNLFIFNSILINLLIYNYFILFIIVQYFYYLYFKPRSNNIINSNIYFIIIYICILYSVSKNCQHFQ